MASPEAHLAAVANSICRASREEMREPPDGAALKARSARLRALIVSDRKLPRVATYLSDVAARRRLLAEMKKVSNKGSGAADAISDIEEAYRLDVEIRTDLQAIGLASCTGPPPRKPIGG